MPTIVTPQVLVYQDFQIVPTEMSAPLRAHISGPNAMLHRYSDATEKISISVGAYDPLNDDNYLWPGRTAGGLVDLDSVRLFIDDALLRYFTDPINSGSTIAPVANKKNWIRSDTLAFRTNGAYLRSAGFYDRDVAIGDVVYLRGISDPDDACLEVELWTTVAGFASETVIGTVDDCEPDLYNPATQSADCTVAPAIAQDGITMTADSTAYDGLPSGYISDVYTIEVTASSVVGCAAARLRVTTASGADNQEEVTPGSWGVATAIGTRGLTVTFTQAVDEELTVGQIWTVSVLQAYERTCCQAGGTYTGAADDTYIVRVTKGGNWAASPEITVTTSKGLDASGPTIVTGQSVAIPIGTQGLTISFGGCELDSIAGEPSGLPLTLPVGVGGYDMTDEQASISLSDILTGLRYGDQFYVHVTGQGTGRVSTLILQDDLPTAMRSVSDLDLDLYIRKDIEVTENRLSDPPNVNYEKETTQLVSKAGITAYDASYTDSSVPLAMPVLGGDVYIEYREWLPTKADAVYTIEDVASLDDVPGPLDPENPLKWGIFRALQNANGTAIKYTAVADPDDLDSWQDVIERVDGRNDMYNFVPLTFDTEVLNLFAAHVATESSPEAGNWKAMFGALQAASSKLIVGQSTAAQQLLHPTSTDGEVVLATLEDNPDATSIQYTLLSAGSNAGFITYGVRAGDIVRFIFTIDAWGTASYSEFTVDSVLSNNTLLLLEDYGAAVNSAQKVEIWRTLTKAEVVDDLQSQAQTFNSSRVCMVWPDYVGTAGVTQEGYFLTAALAGLVSGVLPHQPLTNVEVAGFDDFARTRQFFSNSQLNDLTDGGVWICTTDNNGTPYTRHALTTDVTDLNRREEMIRRNVDSISYVFLNLLRPYIGRCNATPSMVNLLEHEINTIIDTLKTNGTTAQLGSQLIDGSIAQIKIHDLLRDRIYVVLNLTVPAPLNHIELHLVI
jgi:hypothetical protein